MASSLVPTFQQVPYNLALKRVDQGSQSLLEIASLLAEKKDLEEKNILLHIKMSRANIYQYEIATSSSERLLGFFKNYFIYLSQNELKYHKEFLDTLKELEDLKLERAYIINKTKTYVQNSLRDASLAEEALDKAKQHFQKSKSDFERAKEKLKLLERALVEYQRKLEEKQKKEQLQKDSNSKFSMGRMLQSAFEGNPEEDRDKQVRKLLRRKDEMVQAANNVVDKKRNLLRILNMVDIHLQKAASDFESAEVERMRSLKRTIRKFCELERAVLNSRHEQLNLLEEAVNQQNPDEDILLYIVQSKQTELTHKYGTALELIDEYQHKRSKSADWVFTVFDEVRTEPDTLRDLISAKDSLEHLSPAGNMMLESEAWRDSAALEIREEITDMSDYHGVVTQDDLPLAETEHFIMDALVQGLQGLFKSAAPAEGSSAAQVIVPLGEDWGILLETVELRDRFLQELDEKRGNYSLLDADHYESLAGAMGSFLNFCEVDSDAMSAMRILNMANTFYKQEPIASLDDAVQTDKEESIQKIYIQSDPRLKEHPIWKKQGFWEAALKASVFAGMEDLIHCSWDDLAPEALRETVIGVHNLLFGQLGTMSFTMRDQGGLQSDDVVECVLALSRKFQLSEDQEHELVSTITKKAVREHKPSPIIPIPSILQPRENEDVQHSFSIQQPTNNTLLPLSSSAKSEGLVIDKRQSGDSKRPNSNSSSVMDSLKRAMSTRSSTAEAWEIGDFLESVEHYHQFTGISEDAQILSSSTTTTTAAPNSPDKLSSSPSQPTPSASVRQQNTSNRIFVFTQPNIGKSSSTIGNNNDYDDYFATL